MRSHMLWAQPDRLFCVFGGADHIGELQRDSGAVGVVCRLREPPSALRRHGKPGKAGTRLAGRQPNGFREGVVGVT